MKINKLFKKNVKKNKDAPFFISKNREKIFGQKALEMIKKCNDSKYYNPEKGITSIDRTRWLDAQQAEKNVWLRDFKRLNQDNNKLKKENFDNYDLLKNLKFNNVIELGCGPFTNIRYILKIVQAENIHLLDPLLKDYLKKTNCTYKSGKLVLGDNNFLNSVFGKKRSVNFYSCPIEEFNCPEKFDLIVMIDVLEHCYDFNKIANKILETSKKGTYFVFQDKFFDINNISGEVLTKYDAAHPLRVRKELLLNFLEENFITLLSKTKYFACSRGERDLSFYGFYYIGYKK
ncbi:MAG: hypothetical protein A2V72_01160 [Candidatus Nealsonbacteria bacterium RBG_13_37_56]|uniref:Methyltransferase type 11 domain-containing protein n=1 Tax=Candidatus Nealsonbacteria bacterium RBG_13_37_56 TaxID=1801661 RepID=A0A1G2DXV8_9BACT|nr:MAG: hypothetical protein A2V72_01160 [Candidatus Nealsonbacteria bacterium RBG_13_37_56]